MAAEELVALDALFLRDFDTLISDLRALGAGAACCYVHRDGGTGSWTRELCQLVRQAGIPLLPIVVPGNNPPAPAATLDAAAAMGFTSGPIAVDLELTSFPPPAWVGAWVELAQARGYRPLRYGDLVPLQRYPLGAGDWLSHGRIPVRAGQVRPVPLVPDGVVGDQYAVRVVAPSGTSYDASVFDASVFEETPMQLDPNDPIVRQLVAACAVIANIDDAANRILGLDSRGQQYGTDGNPIPNTPRYVADQLEAIRQQLAQVATPDVNALTAALAPLLAAALEPHLPLQVDPAVVAAAVLADLAARLAPTPPPAQPLTS